MNSRQSIDPDFTFSPFTIYQQFEAWVVLGLLLFWRKNASTDHDIYRIMHARIQDIYRLDLPDTYFNEETDAITLWCAAKHFCMSAVESDAVEAAQEQRVLPLLEFARDFELNETWVFIVALLGLLETNHLVNLVIAELQAPDKAPRITQHLLCALVNQLLQDNFLVNAAAFPEVEHNESEIYQPEPSSELSPLDIVEHPLVLQKIILTDNDLPLPLQRMHIRPLFWSILMGRKPLWPGCRQMETRTTWPLSLQQEEQSKHIAQLLQQSFQQSEEHEIWQKFQGVIVRGNPNSGRGNFCYHMATQMNMQAINVPIKIWCDDALLEIACRYARWLPVLRSTESSIESLLPNLNDIANGHSPVAIIWGLETPAPSTAMLEATIELPTHSERTQIWQEYIQDETLSRELATKALLSPPSIRFIVTNARQLAKRKGNTAIVAHIAEARRQLGVDRLRSLAQPVFRQVTAEALVMPQLVENALETLVKRALKRESLWQGLGDTLKATPNPGVRALFVGESGTGKTLAASYIATRLDAPLYRVDLSAVMNKYIGESEKNLAQLLDQAAASDVVLLFDEADALFGSRSEGRETGERFANMLTNFLLTRIENHPGIVILTTNSRDRIDQAFTRRLDSIVEFPLPGFEERLHLWRSHLGNRGPGEDVYRNLASYCDLAGGQLRNVVLTALIHADENVVSTANLLEGLRAEYRKQGREMPKKLEGLAV